MRSLCQLLSATFANKVESQLQKNAEHGFTTAFGHMALAKLTPWT